MLSELNLLEIVYEGNEGYTSLYIWYNGGSQLQRSVLAKPRNVARRNICHGKWQSSNESLMVLRFGEIGCRLRNHLITHEAA